MKTLSENYNAAHGNTNETFADLIFCALVVLVLFVLALAVEVSQRVRATATIPETLEIKAEEVALLTPGEIEVLSAKMHKQSEEINNLQSRLKKNKSRVESQLSALEGEQRFTGAREPAAINLACNYLTGRYNFLPTKLVEHADRRLSGESSLEYFTRKQGELVAIALKARQSRNYSEAEIIAIYQSISQYNEVVETEGGYRLKQEQVGIHYHTLLCQYIAGEADSAVDRDPEVIRAMLQVHNAKGRKHEGMYPLMACKIDSRKRTATISSVELKPSDLRVILISISGRGVVLDFEGYTGRPPKWLQDKVLMPSGYISKTPKLPKL